MRCELLANHLSLLLLWQEPVPFSVPGSGSGASFLLMLVQTVLALGLVCGLAYALFRWVLPHLTQVSGGAPGSMVRIVDRVRLDTRKSLYVIEVAGRWLLVASSESGVQLISELDGENAEAAASSIERRRPALSTLNAAAAREAVSDRFARLLGKRK